LVGTIKQRERERNVSAASHNKKSNEVSDQFCFLHPAQDNTDKLTGLIWAYLKQTKSFYEVANLTENYLLNLYRTMVPILWQHYHCGLQSWYVSEDGLFILLSFYKTGAPCMLLP
jgi:hypothetical protein